MSSELLSYLDVMAISRHDIVNICGCVFCFDCKYTKNCSNCGKKYCVKHISHHVCFNDSEVWN